ncbi:hypothetical protein Tco_0836615 [Tanacetum coccineum]
MMVRLDDFVRLEKAFANTKLLKGELLEPSKKASCLVNIRDDRDYQAPYHSPREDLSRRDPLQLNLNWLTKHPKEVLHSELYLNLPQPRSIQLPPKKENLDKYCDYHREKSHYTNDCYQLRRQSKLALELGKLNHLIKHVR